LSTNFSHRVAEQEAPSEALERQQAIVLGALRAAGGAPVSYAALRDAGVEFPASVVSELELAGVDVERCHERVLRAQRIVGVRLVAPVRQGPATPDARARSRARAIGARLARVRASAGSLAGLAQLARVRPPARDADAHEPAGRRAQARTMFLVGPALVLALAIVALAVGAGGGARSGAPARRGKPTRALGLAGAHGDAPARARRSASAARAPGGTSASAARASGGASASAAPAPAGASASAAPAPAGASASAAPGSGGASGSAAPGLGGASGSAAPGSGGAFASAAPGSGGASGSAAPGSGGASGSAAPTTAGSSGRAAHATGGTSTPGSSAAGGRPGAGGREAVATQPPRASAAMSAELEAHGHELLDAGEYREAIPVLHSALAATGESLGACVQPASETCLTYAYALYDLGRALLLSGSPAAAVGVLEERLRIENQRAVVAAELESARRRLG